MRTIDGLPAHVLFLHIPIVLVPLLCIAALCLVFKKNWRKRFSIPFAIASTLVAIATYATVYSGYRFDEITDGTFDVDKHESLAETTMILVLAMTLLGIIAAGLTKKISNEDSKLSTIGLTFSVLTAGAAAAATYYMYRTGDAGVRNLWESSES